MEPWSRKNVAVWALTPEGANLARTLARRWPGAKVLVPDSLVEEGQGPGFESFSQEVGRNFHAWEGHVFIMAAGIVVRMIAPHLKHKTSDPAVVVMDEAGMHAISLVSGHLGGANDLARELETVVDARPVITTGTDVNHAPAIDVLARDHELFVENPQAIKDVNMAFIKKEPVAVHDPQKILEGVLPPEYAQRDYGPDWQGAGVYVDFQGQPRQGRWLILRPQCLVLGMGCRKGVPFEDLHDFAREILAREDLSPHSLTALATVDIKAREPGLVELAAKWNIPLVSFTRDELNQAPEAPTPSPMAEKYLGVKSVCEAAAMLAARTEKLWVRKQKNSQATLAIAIQSFMS